MKTDKDTVTIVIQVGNTSDQMKVKMLQFRVNSNKLTIGHTIQGFSLKRRVVRSWNYRMPNYIYIVLSRVRILKDKNWVLQKINVDSKLIK